MPIAVKFRPGIDQHIFGETDAAQASLSALHPADGAFVAGGHNDHQVHIAVFGGGAPRVRAEKPDLLRLKFGFQSFDRFFQKARLNGLHAVKITTLAADLKAAFIQTIACSKFMNYSGSVLMVKKTLDNFGPIAEITSVTDISDEMIVCYEND
jgi:hypothetical protein